jgi:hypothetical protein
LAIFPVLKVASSNFSEKSKKIWTHSLSICTKRNMHNSVLLHSFIWS